MNDTKIQGFKSKLRNIEDKETTKAKIHKVHTIIHEELGKNTTDEFIETVY